MGSDVETKATAPEIQDDRIRLKHKPSASLEYSFVPGSGSYAPKTLVVFLNGLVLPRAAWKPVMTEIIRLRRSQGCPPMLAYDRYGQSESDPDPANEGKEEGYGHDLMEVVKDLQQLILTIADLKLQLPGRDAEELEIVFVCNSIGAATGRLYAQTYPRTVSGLIFLDSMMANSDFISMYPDPDAPDFDPSSLPDGVSPDDLRDHRNKFVKRFQPFAKNPEGLDLRNLPDLLPHAGAPVLEGPRRGTPLVTVVSHDPESFAEESLKGMGTAKPISLHYTEKHWRRYNEELVNITAPELRRGPIMAEGCGHFIQRDDPDLVAKEVCDMLDKLAQ